MCIRLGDWHVAVLVVDWAVDIGPQSLSGGAVVRAMALTGG
jgi:hypothetical protein